MCVVGHVVQLKDRQAYDFLILWSENVGGFAAVMGFPKPNLDLIANEQA